MHTPYQLLICVDTEPPAGFSGEAVRVSSRPDAAATLEVLHETGLTPADLRSRTLVVFAAAAQPSLLMYAALCGFSGRRMDFLVLPEPGEAVAALQLGAFAAGMAGPEKPATPPEFVQVGTAHPDVPSVPAGSELDETQIGLIRHARKLRFAPDTTDTHRTLVQFVTVCGLRVRGTAERFPLYVQPGDDLTDADGQPVGVDLDQLRRDGAGLRRAIRSDDRSAVTEPAAPTARMLHLAEAAARPLDEILVRLGSHRNDQTGLWRCPRPERHRNGDANPSTRVDEAGLICFRCDLEPIDTLRVVIDTLNIAPDQAADWILSGAPRPEAG